MRTGRSGSIAAKTMAFTSGSSARMMVGDLHLVVLGCVHPTSNSGQPNDRWMVYLWVYTVVRGLFPYSRGL